VFTVRLTNTNAAARYVKLYNVATAPTAGQATPQAVICIPGGTTALPSVVIDNNANGEAYPLGIGYTVTGEMADSDTTAVTSGDLIVDIRYT
jgi:hypothetical protein